MNSVFWKFMSILIIFTIFTLNGSEKTDQKPLKKKTPSIPEDIYKVEYPSHAVSWGDKNAPVTMVIFDDFQCPFCKKLHSTLAEVKKNYGDKLRIFYIHLPLAFHKNAEPAAKAIIAANTQGKGTEMIDYLFKHQSEWSKEDDTKSYMRESAKALNLDLKKFVSEYNSDETSAIVESDKKIAGKHGVRGTPAAFVNGRYVGGAHPYEYFKQVIDEELKRAEPFLKTDLKGDSLYSKLIKNGLITIKKRSRVKEDPDKIYNIPLTGKEPVLGDAKAPITIIEFSDFQCPYCHRASKTMNKLIEKYRGRVKLIFKHQPLAFHKRAKDAAIYSVSIFRLYGSDKFWLIHDIIFENQKSLTEKNFEIWAKQNGMEWRKIELEMKKSEVIKNVEQDMSTATSSGVRGVPAFFINGKKLAGAQPLERFEEVIDKIILEKFKRNKIESKKQ